MISTVIILIIVHSFFLPVFVLEEEIPLDTSQDILSEGISDPEWIASR